MSLDILAHHKCSPVLQRCLRDEDFWKVALWCHIFLEFPTVDNVKMATVRRWSEARSSGNTDKGTHVKVNRTKAVV